MRIGASAPALGTVSQAVTVGGTFRGARRVSLSRSMGGAPLFGHSGRMGAEGEVTVVSAQDGFEPSIWRRQRDNWPPKPGDSARCTVGTHEAGRWGILQGLIRSVDRVDAHQWRMRVADEMAPLRTTVSIEPLCQYMPGEIGADLVRPGLDADYYAHRAFREAGITNTPPAPSGLIGVSAPMQGSMWPEVGFLRSATAATLANANPQFGPTPWGYALTNGTGVYRSSREGAANLNLGGSFVAVMVPPGHNGATTIILRNSPGTAVGRLTIGAGRSIIASFGTNEQNTELTMPASQSWTRVVVAARNGTLTLSRDDGTADRTAAFTSTSTWRDLEVNVTGGAMVAGLMAGATTATTVTDYVGHTSNLRMHYPVTLHTQLAMQARIHRVKAMDLVSEIAQAALRACWRDEDGVVQWMPWCVAVSRPAVTDVTSTSHALDGWSESESLDDQYRRAVVTASWPEVEASRFAEQTVYEGRGVALENQGTQTSEIMRCPDGEVWIDVDFPPVQMGQPDSDGWRNFVLGRGSFRGGVLKGGGENGNRTRWGYPSAINQVAVATGAVPIGPDAWRLMFVYNSHADLPNAYTVQARTPNEDAVLRTLPTWARDHPLPLYRARVKGVWVDVEAATGSGHRLAGDYDHDGGRWVQGYTRADGQAPTAVSAFATWLSQNVLAPLGTIDLPVHHEPRLQVGDVVEYVDAHRHGITLRCLIVGIDQESWDETGTAGQEMTLRLVVLAVVSARVTYADVARPISGSYADQQTVHQGRTYDQATAAAITGGT